MDIKKEFFGSVPDGNVFSYTLDNGKGLSIEVLTLGGIIRRIVYNGIDVALGHEYVHQYQNDPTYFGALIGRNSNRISGGEFQLGKHSYTLAKNCAGGCNLHGGEKGFNSKIWKAVTGDGTEPMLGLNLTSPDGEEGFPANVEMKVTYKLTKNNSIKIHYEGAADGDTILNMTNHTYFNLNGHDSGSIKNHTLMLKSDFYTPNNEYCMPIGTVEKVEGTPFDFTAAKTIASGFENPNEQFELIGGYDHNFAINGRGFRKFAEAEGDKTHIVMECFTDRPGVQLYTGNAISEGTPGKDGTVYGPFGGFCLETQVFPDAMHFSHFPSGILKKKQKYDTVTEYKFSQK